MVYRLTRLTLVCEVIRYRLVQVQQNLKKFNDDCTCSVTKYGVLARVGSNITVTIQT